MKINKLLIALFVLFGFVANIDAQKETTIFQDVVVEAMNQGNSNKLSQHMNHNVELIVDNKKNIYSKQQAVGILANFFKTNPVKKFSLTHNSDKKSSSFFIGSLETTKGNYRIYFLTREVNKTTLIQQIRIETE